MNVFFFLLKEGMKGLLRSKYAGAFSIIIIWISLVMVGLGYVGARDMLFAVENIRAQFDIDIFLHQSATTNEIADFNEMLFSMSEVDQVEYISPNDAAEKFKNEFGEDIFSILDSNPLPPSFTIRLKPIYRNLISVESISTIISRNKIVDEIKYRKKILTLLDKYQKLSVLVILVTFGFLTLVSIVLISNSIKMAIFSRREIISTMKLIGASDAFVKAPFIIEGSLQGLIGAGLACGIISTVFYVFNTQFQTIVEYKAIVGFHYYIIILAIGTFLGFIGSARAIKRFL